MEPNPFQQSEKSNLNAALPEMVGYRDGVDNVFIYIISLTLPEKGMGW